MADMPQKRPSPKRRTPYNNRTKKPNIKKDNHLDTKVFALGGLNEVGKNMYCIEHDDEIILSLIHI